MTHTARVEPVSEDQEDAIIVLAWRVVDVTDPDAPQEISRHDSEPEAIEAARLFEAETSNEPGSDPDDTQDYDASQRDVGKRVE
ncbi:hypothetical protein B0H98_108110 [Vreelandella songnenensis]|uniref:Uncharacterized protein n=1 Tax=Vreelandella songnenensis TaxID=1176243 RepID=A0A2T0V005_9GAMM|nr:hypothetical protein [Halomonas songnenensis]PRY63515.1 hypothetical protein B0H98_108110 [Halomonas songnenensis]